MKLIIEAYPAQPYIFKLVSMQNGDRDARKLGTAWMQDFYTKLEQYAESYPFDEILVYGPRGFADSIASNISHSDILNYSTAKSVTFVDAGE